MKSMRVLVSALVLAVAVFMSSCGGGTPEKLDWSKTEDKSMDGKLVTIEGYAYLPLMMYTDAGKSTLNMMERMNQYSGGLVQLSLTDGSSENRISSLPDDYYQTDIEIHDKDGKIIEYGDKMRVTGTAKFEDGGYTIDVETIEKIDDTYDYEKEAVRLTESDFDKLDGKMVWSEGSVWVTDEQESTVRMDMLMEDTTLSRDILAKFPYGPIENQALELPDTYYTDDVYFYDDKGDEYFDGSTVRIYGIWNADEEMIAVEKIVGIE